MCFYSLNIDDDKDKSLIRYLRFKNIGSLFRTLEFLFAILFFLWSISRSSPYISSVLQLFTVFLRRISSLVANHHFVFLLGNGIIVTLFVKFCQFSSLDGGSLDEEYQICEAAVVSPYETPIQTVVVPVSDVKQIIAVKKEISRDVVKKYRRSKSSVVDRRKTEAIQLKRSETEPRRNSVSESVSKKFEVDDLSNEEFRKKVESIIEQHRRSLREESMFIVSA